MENLDSVLELVKKGGFFIYPLIFCSIFAVTIFLQKLWMLRLKNVSPPRFLPDFLGILKNGDLKEARSFCNINNSSISRIAETALNNAGKSKEELYDKIELTGSEEANYLGKYIEGFGTISNVATLLGLLGTISGMIKIFGVISEEDIVNPPALAGGISEALYTTALGLSIAIPTFIAYKYIKGRHENLVGILEKDSNKILDIFSTKN